MDISIIIPTHNRKTKLLKCLDLLFQQDLSQGTIEIIVVDDGSTDGTGEAVRPLLAQSGSARYFYRQQAGPAAARNFGIRQARAPIIGFIDDDCLVEKTWARSMIEAHRKENSISAIGGLTVSEGNIPALVSQCLSTGSIEVLREGRHQVIFFPTCNVSFKREVFQTQMFNTTFLYPGGEDLEFFWRLFKAGHRFIWRREIKVLHARNINLKHFIQQSVYYGRGNLRVQDIHRDHPLLKELKTGLLSFWISTVITFIKIPRFSYFMGRRVSHDDALEDFHRKLAIFSYLSIHKVFYLFGTIAEYFSLPKRSRTQPLDPHIPKMLILDVTHGCNLTCRICDIWKTAKSEHDIDCRWVKKMLSEARALGIQEIALSGGEPLLREDIYDIIDHARAENIRNLGILTNGLVINDQLARLKPYLLDRTVSLVLSLDSLRADIHDFIRNHDTAWEKSMQSLKALCVMKRKHPQVNFNVITIILDQNLQELEELARFVKSLGANSLQFQPLLSNNLRMAERKESGFWVSTARLPLLDETIDRLIEMKQEDPAFIKNSPRNLSLIKKYYRGSIDNTDVSCLSADKTFLVSNQGFCTTCFSSYGNLKAEDLKAVLESRNILEAREKVKNCAWPCLLPCFCD